MAEIGDDFTGLDAFFAAGRALAPEPSAGFLARIEADALAVAAARVAAPPRRAPRRGLWQALSEALGGRGAVAGLLTATLASLWLGFAPPADLAPYAQGVTQSVLGTASASVDQLDLLPAVDSVLSPG